MGAERRENVRVGWLPGLFVATTVALQAGVLVLVPKGDRPVVSLAMLVLWMAGLCAVVFVISLRRSRAPRRAWAIPARILAPGVEVPSPQMRAAWSLARAGGDARQVAEVADLPLPLAELLVEDARKAPVTPGDPPGGQWPHPPAG